MTKKPSTASDITTSPTAVSKILHLEEESGGSVCDKVWRVGLMVSKVGIDLDRDDICYVCRSIVKSERILAKKPNDEVQYDPIWLKKDTLALDDYFQYLEDAILRAFRLPRHYIDLKYLVGIRNCLLGAPDEPNEDPFDPQDNSLVSS